VPDLPAGRATCSVFVLCDTNSAVGARSIRGASGGPCSGARVIAWKQGSRAFFFVSTCYDGRCAVFHNRLLFSIKNHRMLLGVTRNLPLLMQDLPPYNWSTQCRRLVFWHNSEDRRFQCQNAVQASISISCHLRASISRNACLGRLSVSQPSCTLQPSRLH